MTYFYVFSKKIPGMSEFPTSLLKFGATTFRGELASADEIRTMSKTRKLILCPGMDARWIQSILEHFDITVATATTPSKLLEVGDSIVIAEVYGVPLSALTSEDEFWKRQILESIIFSIHTVI